MMNEIEIPIRTATITDYHTKLLPCPFCGNDNIHITKKALWQEVDGRWSGGCKDRYAFEVVCDRCGAHPTYYKNDTIYRPEEEAISHVVNKWNSRTMSSVDEEKDESQCDWALVYEYARTMENYLDDLDEVELDACIERIKEIAVNHGGNRINQIMHDKEGHIDIERCVKIIDSASWLLTKTLDIEKREKLYSISLEATKLLRELVDTP